jgi:hypothetical protein
VISHYFLNPTAEQSIWGLSTRRPSRQLYRSMIDESVRTWLVMSSEVTLTYAGIHSTRHVHNDKEFH